MIVVSDTTAITTLLKTGDKRLLAELFREVIIPQGVWDELHAFRSDLPEFVQLRPATEPTQRLAGTETLGRGEAEALKLAKEIGADLLLMDDRRGRKAATRLGNCRRRAAGLGRASQADGADFFRARFH